VAGFATERKSLFYGSIKRIDYSNTGGFPSMRSSITPKPQISISRNSNAQQNQVCKNPRKSVAKSRYATKLLTNSTKLRRAMPDGPFAIHGF